MEIALLATAAATILAFVLKNTGSMNAAPVRIKSNSQRPR